MKLNQITSRQKHSSHWNANKQRVKVNKETTTEGKYLLLRLLGKKVITPFNGTAIHINGFYYLY